MRKMYIVIFRWVGAGLRDCWLFTIIVCETRPYILNIKNLCEEFSLGGGGSERLLVIYNYCL
jgi:hypothetical protein